MKITRINLAVLCRDVSIALMLTALAACGGGNSGGVQPTEVSEQASNTGVLSIGEVIPASEKRVIPIEEARPYRANSAQYRNVLLPCMLVETIDALCPLSTLPYIGQTTELVTVEDIMQRVVVTHDWMGVRFEEMLYRMPADLVQLFAPVTAIIIGSEVRPSSFTPALGLMRLDPETLWVNVDERQTISVDDDPRTDFGPDLQFIGLSRANLGDEYTSYYWPEGSERNRDLIEMPLARLLYHELAHANDYVQRDKIASLSGNLTAWDAINLLEGFRVSKLLPEDLSITTPDAFLNELAGVRFRNEEPSFAHSFISADSVGARMQGTGKMTFYSYSAPQEDVATLLEAAMMKFHYNVDTHVAFANKPADTENAECNDYIVAWGVRNRLASPLVTPRADFVVDKIMTESAAIDDFFSNHIGDAVPLRVGDGWCDSRYLNPSLILSDQPAKSTDRIPLIEEY